MKDTEKTDAEVVTFVERTVATVLSAGAQVSTAYKVGAELAKGLEAQRQEAK